MNIVQGISAAYFLTYKRLMEANRELCDFYKDRNSIYMFPAIINGALSCEIGLKGHIYEETQKMVTGHDLLKLFNQLSEDSKRKFINGTVAIENFQLLSLGKNPVYNEEMFWEDLRASKDTFTNERYIYEEKKHNLNFDFIEAFLFAINGSTVGEYHSFFQSVHSA